MLLKVTLEKESNINDTFSHIFTYFCLFLLDSPLYWKTYRQYYLDLWTAQHLDKSVGDLLSTTNKNLSCSQVWHRPTSAFLLLPVSTVCPDCLLLLRSWGAPFAYMPPLFRRSAALLLRCFGALWKRDNYFKEHSWEQLGNSWGIWMTQ